MSKPRNLKRIEILERIETDLRDAQPLDRQTLDAVSWAIEKMKVYVGADSARAAMTLPEIIERVSAASS